MNSLNFKQLKKVLLIALLFSLPACNVSRLAVGISNDRGDFQQDLIEEIPESGKGFAIDYRYQKMNTNQGYGLSASLHLNGYNDDFEGNGLSFFTITSQYYRYFFKSEQFKLAGYTGLGPSLYLEFPTGPRFVGATNLGLDFYLLEDELLLFSVKTQYYRQITFTEFGRNNFSVQISLGFRFIE